MPVGFEVWNDAGIPQTIDLSHNLVLIASGTVSVGSNTAATGAEGFQSLATRTGGYLVFIKTTGHACILRHRTDGFNWFMAQGTTSFTYYAYARGVAALNAGLQVYNADGSLRWELGSRPVVVSSLIVPGGSTPSYSGENPAGNSITPAATFTIPSEHAVVYSDPGFLHDLYTGVPGYTLVPNMKFWPCISVSGTTLTMQHWRRYANRGSLPGGVNYSSFTGRYPSYILTMPSF